MRVRAIRIWVQVHRRVAQFTNAGLAVLLTSAPLFTEKAALLRGCTFVLGWDTAMRIVMPKCAAVTCGDRAREGIPPARSRALVHGDGVCACPCVCRGTWVGLSQSQSQSQGYRAHVLACMLSHADYCAWSSSRPLPRATHFIYLVSVPFAHPPTPACCPSLWRPHPTPTWCPLPLRRYYNDSETNMLLDFAGLRSMGCSFIVAGRRDEQDGRFKGLEDIDVPPQLADLFIGLSEDDFRVDLSSTELRESLATAVGP
eukprot:363540-Chlamydomonas_euryale.AAC.5